MRPLLLASGSPRRRELLRWMGVPFRVVRPRGVQEERIKGETPETMVRRLAFEKARSVQGLHSGHWVLGADTVVLAGGRILGKPRDRSEAVDMIERLSESTHRVVTGVAILGPVGQKATHVERSKVCFRHIPSQVIRAYSRTREPYDKAGGYAIQGTASAWVSHLEGDYFNVVGLPVDWVADRLYILGVLSR